MFDVGQTEAASQQKALCNAVCSGQCRVQCRVALHLADLSEMTYRKSTIGFVNIDKHMSAVSAIHHMHKEVPD